MRRHLGLNQHVAIVGCLLAVVAILATFGTARADDFNPPLWDRGGPFAMTAEWEFFTSDNPAQPDGPLTDLTSGGNYSDPTSTTATFFGANWEWQTGDGDGEWSALADGGIMINMDNVIDLKPLKEIWIQFTYRFDGLDPGPPVVTDVFGVEGVSNVTSEFVEKDHDGQYAWEHWRMFPNPDRETIFIDVPEGVRIDQIIIDTISIPEPSTLAMIVSGSLGLALCLWRRRRN